MSEETVDPTPFNEMLEQAVEDSIARQKRHADEMYAGMVAFGTGHGDEWMQRKFEEAMKLLDEPIPTGNPGSTGGDTAGDAAP